MSLILKRLARPEDARTLVELMPSFRYSYGNGIDADMLTDLMSGLFHGGYALGYLYRQAALLQIPTAELGDNCSDRRPQVEDGFEYLVKGSDDGLYRVPSAYAGFEVDQCVFLFLVPADDGFAGRIASGADCSSVDLGQAAANPQTSE